MTVANARRTRFDARLTRTTTVSGRKAFVFKISTDREARDGFIIPASAWDFSEYLRNPVVLLAHSGRELPIGRATEVRRDADGLTATIEFDDEDPVARQVQSKVERGFVNATSVGFRVGEIRGNRVLRAELLEVSIVAVPSDAGALLNGRSAYERGVFAGREWREQASGTQTTAQRLAPLVNNSRGEAAAPLLAQLRTLDTIRRVRRLGPAEHRLYNSLVNSLRGII